MELGRYHDTHDTSEDDHMARSSTALGLYPKDISEIRDTLYPNNTNRGKN
jgi:hypothetical protein